MPRFRHLLVYLEDEHERELKELRNKFDKELEEMKERVNLKVPSVEVIGSERESAIKAVHVEWLGQSEIDDQQNGLPHGTTGGTAEAPATDGKQNCMQRGTSGEEFDSAQQKLSWYESGSLSSRSRSSIYKGMSTPSTHSVGVDSILTSHIQRRLNRGQQKNKILAAILRKTRSVESDFVVDDSSGFISRLVHNAYFDSVCAVMIILNAVFLGISTSYDEPSEDPSEPLLPPPLFHEICDNVFSAWFIAELILRMRAEGIFRFFCFSRNLRWNLFDFVVVGSDVFAIIIRLCFGDYMQVLGNLTIMRLLRVLRVARALRVVRLVTFFSELRMMVLSIWKSGMALFWSLVLLCMIIFIFGIFLMQSVSQYLEEQDAITNRSDLIRWFGTLPTVGFTLFLCVTNGVSWVTIADLLTEIHWTNTLVLSFFIFFTIFAMLNIITGIFVETAISAVQNDKDEVIKGERNSETSLIKRLEHIFNKADCSATGSINMRQFESIMTIEETRFLMKTMGLEVNEARNMFNIMDTDRSGEVNIEEFLVGCMRMKGAAKSIDLIALSYENKKLMDLFEEEVSKARKFRSGVEACLAALQTSLKHAKSWARHNDVGNDSGNGLSTPSKCAAYEDVCVNGVEQSPKELISLCTLDNSVNVRICCTKAGELDKDMLLL